MVAGLSRAGPGQHLAGIRGGCVRAGADMVSEWECPSSDYCVEKLRVDTAT
jgi:hypothetical protein